MRLIHTRVRVPPPLPVGGRGGGMLLPVGRAAPARDWGSDRRSRLGSRLVPVQPHALQRERRRAQLILEILVHWQHVHQLLLRVVQATIGEAVWQRRGSVHGQVGGRQVRRLAAIGRQVNLGARERRQKKVNTM